MDKMLRIPQIFHQRPEFLIAVDEDIHIIVLRQHGFSGLQIIHDQILIPPDILIQLLDIPGSQPVLLLPDIFADVILHLFDPEHFPLVHILPQQQIEHEPQYRYKIQQKQPCPHALRIPSLENTIAMANNILKNTRWLTKKSIPVFTISNTSLIILPLQMKNIPFPQYIIMQTFFPAKETDKCRKINILSLFLSFVFKPRLRP
mgnify:CR=1 FL=1